MQALIALGHFCELHGPSLLVTTQPIYQSSSSPSLTSDHEPTNDSAQIITECCEGCHSVCVESVMLSVTGDVKFISSKYPMSNHLIPLLKQACFRSLSCEVCPEKGTLMYFGDSARGHILSYTFLLKDSKSRGFKRLYCVIVFMWDEMYLLNMRNFFLSHIQNTVTYLQAKSSMKYDKEISVSSQRSFRLSGNPESVASSTASARSLADITELTDVYLRIHVHFSWMLLIGGLQYKEEIIEGPPLLDFNCSHEKSGVDGTRQESVICCLADPKFSIRHLYSHLGHGNFVSILSTVLIGGCCIITSDIKKWVHIVVKLLLTLAPNGLCLPAYVYDDEEQKWSCYMAGNPIQFEVHSIATCQEHVRLVITLEANVPTFSVVTSVVNKCPSYLSVIIKAINNSHLCDQVLCTYIRNAKLTWTNKVKTLTSCLDSGGSVEAVKKLYKTFAITETDFALVRFWSQNRLC